ncbi:MAG: hypothetical protein ACO3VQ_09720 [Ilumatobacteraceae bacterium]
MGRLPLWEESAAVLQVVIDVVIESFPSVLRNLNNSIQLRRVRGVIPRVVLLQLNKGD